MRTAFGLKWDTSTQGKRRQLHLYYDIEVIYAN